MTRSELRISGKRVLIGLSGVLALVLVLALRYFGHYRPFADLIGNGRSRGLMQATLQITDATVTGRSAGHRRWRVQAQTITLSRDRTQVNAQGIHDGILFTSAGQPLFTLSAGHATYRRPFGALDTQSSTPDGYLTLSGGIVGQAIRPGGPTLRSEMLIWDAARSEVRSFGHTTATFPKSVQLIGGLTMEAPLLVWDAAHGILHAPGTVVASFSDGISRVQGDDIQVDTQRGDLALHHLHGTFRVPDSLE